MRKIMCICMALVLFLVSFCSPIKVYANEFIDSEMYDAAELFIILRDSGKLFADENGYYVVTDNDYKDHPAYGRLLTVVGHCNDAIAAGVLEITKTNEVQLRESAIIDKDALIDLHMEYEETASVTSRLTRSESDYLTCGITNPNPDLYDDGSGSAHFCLAMTFDRYL